ncbi:hypothetical protein C5167_012016 [Papaver somniferum]|uniref:F-box domain-containing protein n=1 Tax=Papaver somniferum TaxID=3469 RepID=A0A4Y7IZN4_PAPSO|nr:hypothetical protein C5167_012016 [Papaver somniferum]
MDYFHILPVEITLDILKRLPVETVKECKLVSKTWKNLIHHPKFAEMHFTRLCDSSTENVTELVHKLTELEAISENEVENWYKTEEAFKNFMDFYLQILLEIMQMVKSLLHFGKVMENHNLPITDLGGRYNSEKSKEICCSGLVESRRLFTENCRLYNEFLKSKGNVRVYGRVRPCPDKNQTTIQSIGENGELVIADPSIHTDDGHRLFKFNKVYDQQATKEEIFLDTQPVIRSVIDGYNVCIFTLGQSGWEKTNKTGLGALSPKNWGVHFEALNVLFQMSRKRRNSFTYKIDVQMVEIYNEQVRDLLQIGVSHNKHPLF